MSDGTRETARDHPGVIAPPPLIALVTVIAGLVMDWQVPFFFLGNYFSWTVRLAVGGALVVAGVMLAMAAESRFRSAGTNVMPWKPALALATGGVYQWVRNPMYVGLGLAVAGIGIGLGSEWTLILLVPAAWVLHNGVVLREERYLEAKFGEAYRQYTMSVPRYGWPR
jgi:protein-S-isoprenylcysteine O-methyltransferase Ste14